MARHHLDSPTVFGHARGQGGFAKPILLMPGEKTFLGDVRPRKMSIYLRGSDGRRTDTVIESSSTTAELSYSKLLELLDEDTDNIERRTNLSAGELRDEELLVSLWPDAYGPRRPVDGFHPEFGFSGVADRPLSWQAPKSQVKTAFLQFAFEDGPSVIGVCPGFAARVMLVRSDAGPGDGRTAAVPTFEGDGRLADAYGWFLATKAGDAADLIGARLAEQALENKAGARDYHSLVAAIQWCFRTGEDRRTAVELSRLLSEFRGRADGDALMLIASFHHRSDFEGHFESNLGPVLSSFRGSPPRLSETMGLLVDRLMPMRSTADRLARWTQPDEEAFAWVTRLADAMIWDVPTTAFRGLDPLSPDPNAILPHEAGAKKKSGDGQVSHPRATRSERPRKR